MFMTCLAVAGVMASVLVTEKIEGLNEHFTRGWGLAVMDGQA